MILKELLLNFIPSRELKSRIANGQIRINNEVVTNVAIDLNIQDGYWTLGDFIYHQLNDDVNKALQIANTLSNFRDFFGEPETNIKYLKFLSGYTLIKISKKEEYVFINS